MFCRRAKKKEGGKKRQEEGRKKREKRERERLKGKKKGGRTHGHDQTEQTDWAQLLSSGFSSILRRHLKEGPLPPTPHFLSFSSDSANHF